jgi:DNA polymerase-1
VERYFQRYPGVRRFMDDTRAQARELGYVETVFGRRLYLPDIRSGNPQLRQYAERSAGTAADIIKRAMIAIDAWTTRSAAPARLIMQVHDELVFEVPEGLAPEFGAVLREHMVNAATLSVPLRVDIGTGANWDEAH